MENDTTEGNVVHNIRCMFLAGLADGMDKPKLIIAPFDYQPPIDIRDDVEVYSLPAGIPRIVAVFCPKIVEYSSQAEPSGIDRHTLLQSLSIGDPRAENEMTTLERYYLPTDQYERALRGEVNLVVGRKDGLIDGDRYFLSPRIKTLRAIRAKIRPEPVREPLPPPPKRYEPPRGTARQRRRGVR